MDHEPLDRTLIDAFNGNAFAGLAAGIVKDGQLVYSRAFGLADASRKIPAATDTSFRIGSISKTFTAIGLMQLHEQGKFKLDDPVSGYLKAYKIEHFRGSGNLLDGSGKSVIRHTQHRLHFHRHYSLLAL